MVSQMEDFTSSRAFRVTGPTAFAEASITHCDVDHLMIYDVRCSQLGEASRICRSTASRIWALCRAPRPAPSSPSATLPPAHQIVIPGQVTHAYLLALAVATKGQSASLIGAYRQRPSAAAGARPHHRRRRVRTVLCPSAKVPDFPPCEISIVIRLLRPLRFVDHVKNSIDP